MISRVFDLQRQVFIAAKRHAHSVSVSLSGSISKPTAIAIPIPTPMTGRIRCYPGTGNYCFQVMGSIIIVANTKGVFVLDP